MKHFYRPLLLLICSLCIRCGNTEEVKTSHTGYLKSLNKETIIESINYVDSLLLVPNNTVKRQGLLYLKKGINMSKLQKDELAIVNYTKALSFFKKLNYDDLIGDTYWHLASTNTYLSNISLANEQLLIAQEYSKNNHNKELEAKVYGTLAHIQFLYKDYNQAIEYTKKAIAINESENDTLGLSATYDNLAIIYKNTGNFIGAIDYNLKALDLSLLQKDQSGIAKSYNNLGLTSEKFNQTTEAYGYFQKAISINTEINSTNTSAHRNLALLLLEHNELEEAEFYYKKSSQLERNSHRFGIQKHIYNKLLELSLKKEDFKSSIKYMIKRDSVESIFIQKQNDEKLSFVKNEHKAVARENTLKQENDIKNKNIIIFIVLSGFLLLLLIYVIQRHKNTNLKFVQEKLELEQSILRSQMNPHFIFNALSAIQNSLLDNNPIQSASYISRFAKLIRQNFDFINEKSILLAEEIDVLRNYMDTQKMRYQDRFDYEINVFADVDIQDTDIPPLLLQPFVENAIEHGFKNMDKIGWITITISKELDAISYTIKDNGRGFTSTNKDSKTHAIDIFKKRLKLLNNKDEESFVITSSEKGTTIKFSIKQC